MKLNSARDLQGMELILARKWDMHSPSLWLAMRIEMAKLRWRSVLFCEFCGVLWSYEPKVIDKDLVSGGPFEFYNPRWFRWCIKQLSTLFLILVIFLVKHSPDPFREEDCGQLSNYGLGIMAVSEHWLACNSADISPWKDVSSLLLYQICPLLS